MPNDVLALTLGGTKKWPKAKALMAFARAHCDFTEARAKALLEEVAQGVQQAAHEAAQYISLHESFRAVGTLMLAEWQKGLALSILPNEAATLFTDS
jgi:serine/threonine-protein kinase HipA